MKQKKHVINTPAKCQRQTIDKSPFAELAYFIRNFFLRLTTNTFMSGIPNHSLSYHI